MVVHHYSPVMVGNSADVADRSVVKKIVPLAAELADSDYLPDLVSVKLSASVTNELQHRGVLKTTLTCIRVKACTIYYNTSLYNSLGAVFRRYLLRRIDVNNLSC